eukprot:3822470-Prymnesium_polylepis.2
MRCSISSTVASRALEQPVAPGEAVAAAHVDRSVALAPRLAGTCGTGARGLALLSTRVANLDVGSERALLRAAGRDLA